MAVIDELERRLEALKQEVADIETAIRVLRTLRGEPVAKLAADQPMFSVRRMAPADPPKSTGKERLTGDAYFDQMERAEKLRDEVVEVFRREGKWLHSGQVIDRLGRRGKGKTALDQVYNAIATLARNGILVRADMSEPWRLAEKPAQPGENERAA